MIYCQNCGNKLIDGAKFCGKCGTKTSSEIKTENNSVQPNPVQVNQVQVNQVQVNPVQVNPVQVNPEKSKSVAAKGKKGKIPKLLIVVLLAIIIVGSIGVVTRFVGGGKKDAQVVYQEDVLDKATGYEFYDMDEIPCLETDDEFNEIYLPYMTRGGLAERYRTAELFGEYILSEAYFDEHTYEEWREAMGGIYAENWEEVEELAEAYEDMLFDLELAKDNGKDNKFSIQFFLEVHAEEKVDKEEMAMLLERADKYNLDPVDMLVANMGISAEKAKKLGRVYWNKETSKATAAKWNDEADKQELRENVLKTTKFIGQGASVVGSVMTFGGLGLLTQVAVVVTNTDTILNMGEQTAVYLLGGDKVGKKTFITDIRKYSKIAAPIAALFTFDIKSIKDGANNLSKLYEIVGLGSYVKARTDEMEKGELLGLDISGDQPESKVYEDSKELAKDLEEKGVNLKDETITDDDFEDMDEDSSWIDASEEDQDAYLERRDQKVLVEKADEEEGGAKNYEEVEKNL